MAMLSAPIPGTPFLVEPSHPSQSELDQALQHAQSCFTELLTWLLPPQDQRRLVDIEQELGRRLWALGRALLSLWFLHRRPRQVERTLRGPDGRFFRRQGPRRTQIKSIFGPVAFERDLYVVGNGKRGDTFYPLDKELGLVPSGFSLQCIAIATYLCTKMAFAQVAATLERFYGWAPATKSLLRMVDQVGPLARPFLEQQGPPTDDGEILVLEVDGRGAPMISDTEMQRRRRPHRKRSETESKWRCRRKPKGPRKRRRKGDKSKNAKVATVAVIYTVRPTEQGMEGPIHKRVYASFRRTEELFIWLLGEAKKRGYGRKRTLFLADGDPKLWGLQKKYLPEAEGCIDWYHVAEKLWEVSTCWYAEGTEEQSQWVKEQLDDLRSGKVERVIHRLDDLSEELKGKAKASRQERVTRVMSYLARHARRMPYAKWSRENLPIGTGAAEGAVRQLVAIRLDGPGMRWSPKRAEWVLQLRCIALNEQWDDFTAYFVDKAHTDGLREQRPPGLGCTHNAKPRAAA